MRIAAAEQARSPASARETRRRGGVMTRITTHVLDTGPGRPAAGIAVRLERVDGPRADAVAAAVTDSGRPGSRLAARGYSARPLPAGVRDRRLVRATGRETLYPEIVIDFARARNGVALPPAAAARALRLFHLPGELTMSARLAWNGYGKAAVRLVKVDRAPPRSRAARPRRRRTAPGRGSRLRTPRATTPRSFPPTP